jgi:hypothetical protein
MRLDELRSVVRSVIREDFNKEIEMLSSIGYNLVDKETVGQYALFLIHHPDAMMYQIGITSNNRSFTTTLSQEKTKKATLLNNEYSVANKFKSVIGEWLNDYSPLYVGSLNKNKTIKYHNILRGLGFNVGEITHVKGVVVNNQQFPESWNFMLT